MIVKQRRDARGLSCSGSSAAVPGIATGSRGAASSRRACWGSAGWPVPDLLNSGRGRGRRVRREAERHPLLAERRPRPHGDLGPQARRPERFPRPVRRHPHEPPGRPVRRAPARAGERMDRLAILRTVNHGTGDHTKGNHWMLTGYEGPAFNAPDNEVQRRPSIGSAVARLRAPESAGAAALRGRAPPPRRDRQPLPLRGLPRRLRQPVHRRVRPERPEVPGQEPDAAQAESRSAGWRTAAACSRRWTGSAATPTRGSATSTPTTSAPSTCSPAGRGPAFDIAAEPAMLRDRYGRHTFGQSALLARRLVEAGAPFVTVNCVPWDHHGTARSSRPRRGPQADPAARPGDRRPDRRPDRARPVRLDAGRGDGRVRPDPADEHATPAATTGARRSAC